MYYKMRSSANSRISLLTKNNDTNNTTNVRGGSEERKCRLCKASMSSLPGGFVFLELRDRDEIPLLLGKISF